MFKTRNKTEQSNSHLGCIQPMKSVPHLSKQIINPDSQEVFVPIKSQISTQPPVLSTCSGAEGPMERQLHFVSD